MATPLKWDALTDLAAAAAYIGLPATPADGTQDEVNLAGLINSVSRAIRKWCKRQFTPERTGPLKTDPIATGTAKVLDYKGKGFVSFRPWEPRTVTSVTILAAGDTGTPWALTGGQHYVLMPRNRTDEGTYLFMSLITHALGQGGIDSGYGGEQLPARRGFRKWPGGYALTVTGDWGMAAIPDDVIEACHIAINEAWANPEDFAQRATGELEAVEIAAPTHSLAGASALPFPPRAMARLEEYRRAHSGI